MGFSEGCQGCSEGYPEGEARGKSLGEIRIGFSKVHRRIRIGLPKVHGRFRIGPPQVSHAICPH